MKRFLPLALMLFLIPTLAHADSMTWDFSPYGSPMTFYIPGKAINTWLGTFTINITDTGSPDNWPNGGKNILAFCVDLERSVGNSQNVVLSDMADWHQPYNSPVYPVYTGAGSYVAYMMGYNGMPDTSMERAAMQLAVWEVLYENKGLNSFDVSSGQAYASGPSSDVVNQANLYLGLLNSLNTVPNAHAPWIQTLDGYQDFTTPVPEPSTLVLLGAGLLIGGVVARRNIKKQNQ